MASPRKSSSLGTRGNRTSKTRPVAAKKKTVSPGVKKVSAPVRRRSSAKAVISRRTTPPRKRFVTLQKYESNPIVEPRTENFWELKATFNPAALYADGHVHLLYRAIGGDDMSTLGYAMSDDGVTIVGRPDAPAFAHKTKGTNPLVSAPRSIIFRAEDVPAVRRIRVS